MNKHTPGPWVIAETVEGRHTKTNMRRIRCANEGFEHGAVCEVYGIKDGTVASANARLIAAAPELLEALVEILGWQTNLPFDVIAQARTAIAKATGKEI